jgi:predicted site-specific integrase-resolvase
MQEDLIFPQQAAKMFFVSSSMIYYWIRKGRIQKYYLDKPENCQPYKVSISEIKKIQNVWWKDAVAEQNPNLISRKDAADLIGVSPNQITYYAKHGHLKRYYVLGNNLHYMVDREEVLKQPDRVLAVYRDEARREHLRQIAKSAPKNGKFFAKRTD